MRASFLLLLLLLLPLSFSCSGQASLFVPAVIGNGGGLVNATMKLVPGEGNVFVAISPRTASDTQQSVEDAVMFAKAVSGMEESTCDILLTFENENMGGYIEGPSAGVAMSVMALSMLENSTLRQDTVLTGSIDSGGHVGAVGGLHEKAKAAALGGASYFITPPVTFYEMLVLGNMEEEYGITIIEAYDASDIFGFMLHNRTINQTGFRAGESEPPDVEPYGTSGVENFREVAQDMLLMLNATLQRMEPEGNESAEAKRFFENKLLISSALLEKGYFFTAANGAFLDYIDVATISAILDDDLDLKRKRDESYFCLDSINRPEMTDRNFQWLIGSELREGWALDTLNSTEIEEPLLTEERYAIYHELMYADAWCRVAWSLSDAAGTDGKLLDQGIWKDLAAEMIEEADRGQHDVDTSERLEIARKSYERGKYGAAVFDAVFVIRMDQSSAEADMLTPEELTASLETMANAEMGSLWGKVYQAQGYYLMQQRANTTAYRIFSLAQGLDTASALMKLETELDEDGEAAEETQDELVLFFRLLIFILFILLLTYVTLKKRAKGRSDGNNNKGRRGSARAEQKEGRARIS
ncbi:MAG: S16 family serine protease [Candidatus Micrarchaeota archaeon]